MLRSIQVALQRPLTEVGNQRVMVAQKRRRDLERTAGRVFRKTMTRVESATFPAITVI